MPIKVWYIGISVPWNFLWFIRSHQSLCTQRVYLAPLGNFCLRQPFSTLGIIIESAHSHHLRSPSAPCWWLITFPARSRAPGRPF